MTIKVLYFAAARERAGTDGETLDLGAPLSVEALVTHLCEARPRLAEIRSALRVAINLEFVADAAQLIANGDEVALIPPVSGG